MHPTRNAGGWLIGWETLSTRWGWMVRAPGRAPLEADHAGEVEKLLNTSGK